MEIFRGENLLEFTERFSSDEKCKEYLAEYKWKDGYKCKKCGHTHYQTRKDHSRSCNICGHIESPTANTMLHRVRFGIKKAFHIIFEVTNSSRGMSASQIAKRYSISRTTAHYFLHRIRKAMESSESYPMTGKVVVDEFVIGGKESQKPGRSYDSKKKKVVLAVELTEENKVKRIYSKHIDNYSAEEIQPLFDKHISTQADILADKWKAYDKIHRTTGYEIKQEKSDAGKNFFEIHTMIHQVKTTIRTIYSWVSKKYIQKYLDEMAYRINRSLHKDTIVHNLIARLVDGQKMTCAEIMST